MSTRQDIQYLVPVRCGSTYGLGIYSTPRAEYTLAYTDLSHAGPVKTSQKDLAEIIIIVCATLMGHPLGVTGAEAYRTPDVVHPNAHSHIGHTALEWIVSDPAQIIPCYVLHLDLKSKSAQNALAKAPSHPLQWPVRNNSINLKNLPSPGKRQALAREKKAIAAKYFPYGFGPGKGTSFVIEEIGETSDDEESYGDFQRQKLEVNHEMKTIRRGNGWMDEYQGLRHSWSPV